jgi:hypothetical protein
MQFVPRSSNHSPEVKALVEQSQRLPFSPFVCLFLADQGLDFLGKESADRGLPARSENLGLLEYLSAKTYGDVLLLFFS